MIIENSNVHKPYSYTKSQFKDKDSIPSYQYIASSVSNEVYPTIKRNAKPSQDLLYNMGSTQRQWSCRENDER